MRIDATLDCLDLEVTAAFWEAALGYHRAHVIDGRYVSLSGDGPTLTLQRVPEPKAAKNRLHLDLLVADVDAEVARLRSLGASVLPPGVREEFGQRWFVLADPEGNEFCVGGASHVTRNELIARALRCAGAVEDYPFGEDVLTVKVGGKVFVWIPLAHAAWLSHGPRMAVKLPADLVIELRQAYRGQVHDARPLDPRYWVAVPLSGPVPDTELGELLALSYRQVVAGLPRHRRPDAEANRTIE